MNTELDDQFGYTALDGTRVRIPPPPELVLDPLPKFGPDDQYLLDKLLSWRGKEAKKVDQYARHISNKAERPMQNPYSDTEEGRRMWQEFQMRSNAQGQDFVRAHKARLAARIDLSEKTYGKDGKGLLDALNDGSAIADFWIAIARILGFPKVNQTYSSLFDNFQYISLDAVGAVADMLDRFPEGIRVALLSEICLPDLDPPMSFAHREVFAEYLLGPNADFRLLESRDVAAEPSISVDPVIKDPAVADEDTVKWHDLRSRIAERLQKVRDRFRPDRGKSSNDEVVSDPTPADAEQRGETTTHGNQSVEEIHRAIQERLKVARPPGHFIRNAFNPHYHRMTVRLDQFPQASIWPYVAENLDHLDAILRAPADGGEKKTRTYRAGAVSLLRLLPKVPARFGDVLLLLALEGTVPERKDARACLAGCKAFAAKAEPYLSDKKAAVRAQAAQTLAVLGNPDSRNALQAQLKVEKAKKTREAIEEALAALTPAGKAEAFDLNDLVAEVEAEAGEPFPEKVEWLSEIEAPELSLVGDGKAPKGLPKHLLRMAVRLDAPGGSSKLDARLALLNDVDRDAFALAALRAWIKYDTATLSEDQIDRMREHAKKYTYEGYIQERQWYFDSVRQGQRVGSYHAHGSEDDPPLSRDEYLTKYEKRWQQTLKRDIYYAGELPNNGAPARGIFALCRHGDPVEVVALVGEFLSAHGKRMAQSKAMIEMVAGINAPAADELLQWITVHQKQKSLRSHAAKLLGAKGGSVA